ncbi:MAG TPA: hypothetical protein VEX68_08360, partial [Bryobacteraceae bacterium]|nr:hypothetical protein [Bryobacteraceae bacterium]
RVIAAAPNRKGEYASTLGSTKVQVKVNGDWMPAVPLLSYKTQVNALLPFGLTGPTIELQVENDGVQSVPIVVNVREATPGIFTTDASGIGQAAVLNYDQQGVYTSTNSTQRPVKVGGYISVYATGCGDLTPRPTMNSIVDANTVIPSTAAPVAVSFDKELTVVADWAGSVPGMVSGLCQINVKVPPIVNPRSKVPINLEINGHKSAPETFVSISN